MPTFDVVSEIDEVELRNAVDNATRELSTRFDFRGVTASVELKDLTATLTSESDFQVRQIEDLFRKACAKRGVDTAGVEMEDEPVHSGKTFSLNMTFRQGIDQPTAKAIVKLLKEKKLKVQASIQGERCGSVARSATTSRRPSPYCASLILSYRCSSIISGIDRIIQTSPIAVRNCASRLPARTA